MTSPSMWYLNRGTGVALTILFTLVVILGILATRRGPAPAIWPRFVTSLLHRRLATFSLVLMLAHAATAVIDEYVDISWRDAFVPFGASYKPLYLGIGALALDLTLAAAFSGVLRDRLPERVWRGIHLLTYPAWVAGIVHGLGIGTDSSAWWVRDTTIVCITLTVVAVAARLVSVLRYGARVTSGARASVTSEMAPARYGAGAA